MVSDQTAPGERKGGKLASSPEEIYVSDTLTYAKPETADAFLAFVKRRHSRRKR